MNFGGIALDANFAPRPPSFTAPRLNQWFVNRYIDRTKNESKTSLNDDGDGDHAQVVRETGRVKRIGLIIFDFITRDLGEAVIRMNFLRQSSSQSSSRDMTSSDHPKEDPAAANKNKENKMCVFRVGPNRGGGEKWVFLSREYFFGFFGRDLHHVENICSLRVIPYMSDHSTETFSADLRDVGGPTMGIADANTSIAIALCIRRTDQDGKGWGNDLWLQCVGSGHENPR